CTVDVAAGHDAPRNLRGSRDRVGASRGCRTCATARDQEPEDKREDLPFENSSDLPSHRGCDSHAWLPNGSRLSCGRNVRGRKAVERQTKRLASEATQFFSTCERPTASSAC